MDAEKEYRGEYAVGRKAKRGEKRGSGWYKELLVLRGIPQYMPNSIYKVGRYYYETDPIYRRVTYAHGYLCLRTAERHTSQQKSVGKLVHKNGDAGGHLFACQFYGSGHAINMVPMNAELNHHGDWAKMERDFRRYLTESAQVHVAISIEYIGASIRPIRFYIECRVRYADTELITCRYRIQNTHP
jgi:hypothetical protein